MAMTVKTQEDILAKLNIYELNEMQKKAISVVETNANTVILSPTGTGKTLGFLLPALKLIDPENKDIQVLILVPSRELAIQIEQVIREMGTGFKVNAVYGGRSMAKDKIELKHIPSILIGTPGRILDHFANERFSKDGIKTLILDEFDKSLEVGFESEMRGIINQLPNLKKRILTSATQETEIPQFVGLTKPTVLNYLTGKKSRQLTLKTVVSPIKNKNKTLHELLQHVGNQQGIIFCNLKDSINHVSEFLEKNKIAHSCFSGGMEQRDRERSLIKFRNGTSQVLIATDLAARGIDIPEMKYIIHYELPERIEEFTHRNGRTARVNEKGTAYILKWQKENLPDFLKNIPNEDISQKQKIKAHYWETLFISGGRKDKISKGDIAGLFFKKGNLTKEQLGVIELKQDCAFIAVPVSEAKKLIEELNNTRLKNKKVRITLA
ncbi:DEAD/DEAH box helicase [Tenacibaculum finnmarkense]|uniref:DEAD/DEAH box helicase n=1 Tax=Tenacibaculum finnmarkense genomovar finnmarkense TaxID=1458503 RepID=A0AAP1RES4_9FLAO|nr:DEAD/DEAH box helicase [Tenacibaculum finnmarkense]MBE7652377.1 DEAD/DEAH box helicase [Tenacibaculum finnmarkense genomovar finnmarkense]MBE7660633.1 DEAD/DEAH box helicase [Tenacibaculum finnmarkense genomovar finnmarkense]MBE7694813.1 DEAD/DEAH box helicase [Tenacibaculum finnmarkense genomovar finnmarkense]MCD8403873.1 DEAD/DEAH box helicase [Tenacibaculum finnmarkense genomovar finnmarkense]MCD8427892.1 DEAD/DEAH box helicase [Tenacibaculum finnmarkense genomovar finnmarkense]